MRIGIDARMISHPGIGRYIRELLKGLDKVGTKGTYTILAKDQGEVSDFLSSGAFSFKKADVPIYSIKEQLVMPFKTKGVDLFHFTHYNTALLGGSRFVATVHDLLHLIFPEYLPSRAARLYAALMFSYLSRNAARIIAVSENTKIDLIKHLGTDPGKIDVIYEGVGDEFKRLTKEQTEPIKRKYNLPESFILYVGTLKPHKNVINVIDAYRILRNRKKISEELVIVGRRDRKAKHINEVIDNLRPEEGVRYLGEIPDSEMAYIYNLAKIFVFPSLYEGFGLPVLEAMACGVPVLCSDCSSLPEIAGDAALLVDPLSIEQISDRMYMLLSDENLRQSLIEKGLSRAKKFSWQDTAEKTQKVYKEILGA